jgi:hypothetical protein
MVGFYGGDPIDSASEDALGTSILPAPTGQAIGSALRQGISQMPTVRVYSEVAGGDALTDEPTNLDQQTGQAPAPTAPAVLDAETANKQYGIPGVLSWKAPVSEDVAQGLHDDKHAELVRQDIINRSSGIGADVGTFAANVLPQFADPINLASALIPGIGEERAASILGEGIAARLAAGATQGVAGQAALEPLNYALDQQSHDDWTMGLALQNILFGGILGGGLHLLMPHGAIDDPEAAVAGNTPATPEQMANPISAQMEAAGPDARALAAKNAISSLMEDQPNSVGDLMDAGGFKRPGETPPPEASMVRLYHATDNVEGDAKTLSAARPDDIGATHYLDVPSDSPILPRNDDGSASTSPAGIPMSPEMAAALKPYIAAKVIPDQATAIDNLKTALTQPLPQEAINASEQADILAKRAPAVDGSNTESDLGSIQAHSDRVSEQLEAERQPPRPPEDPNAQAKPISAPVGGEREPGQTTAPPEFNDRWQEGDEAELQSINDQVTHDEGTASAYEAAASCLATRGFW